MSTAEAQPVGLSYQPLKNNEIRLLRVLPGDPDDAVKVEMFTASLDEHVRYNALSYTWGNPEPPVIIHVDGIPVPVGVNLEEALKAARRVVAREPVDWKWQREEIEHANFGITEGTDHKSGRIPGMSKWVEWYNNSTRTTWDPRNVHVPVEPEDKKKLLEEFEGMDDAMKERMQSWWQLFLRVIFVGAENVLEGYCCEQCDGVRGEDVQSKFNTKQMYVMQAGVEQEEILRKLLATSTDRSFSMQWIYDKIRGFLDTLHAESPQHLWIDALCINQQDIIERNHEVRRMGLVYSRSAKVVVWLGPQEDNSEKAIDFFVAANNQREDGHGEPDPESFFGARLNGEILSAVVVFFTRPWFERVWIIQEYLMSNKGYPRFMCGETQFGSRGIAWIIDPIATIAAPPNSNLQTLNLFNRFRIILSQPLFRTRSNYQRSVFADRMRRRLLPWLAMYRNSKATDPRDKIFAFLGLINQEGYEHYADMTSSSRKDQKMCEECLAIPLDYVPGTFVVDYSQPVVDLYSSIVRSSLEASNSLNILTACHDRSSLVERTWVPDWTMPVPQGINKLLSPVCFLPQGVDYRHASSDPDTPEAEPPKRFMASGDRSAEAKVTDDLQYLKAKGVLWAEVCWIMARPDGEASVGHGDKLQGGKRWTTPIADSEFLKNTQRFLQLYQKTPELQGFIRRALRMSDSQVDDGEFAQIFGEWEEYMEKWSTFNKAFGARISSVQSQMKYPTKEFQGITIISKEPKSVQEGEGGKDPVHDAKTESNPTEDFDEARELELKEQESKLFQDLLTDYEQMASAAVSKKLFNVFWQMQISKRRFMIGKPHAESARLYADVCKCPDCGDGFGQGPIGAEKGDMVCILLGCDVPMLVRRDVESGFYDLVGPCYWLGAMHGEAMAAVANNEVELVELTFR